MTSTKIKKYFHITKIYFNSFACGGAKSMFIFKGKSIYLSADLSINVIKSIYKWHSDLDDIYLFNFLDCKQMTLESFTEKIKRLADSYLAFFMIYDKETNEIIGCIGAYEYSIIHNTARVMIFIDKKYRNDMISASTEAGIIFFNYLFQYFPLRKLCANIISYNQDSYLNLKSAGLVLEGIERKQWFFDGKYYDKYIMGMFREEFYKKLESIKHLLDYEVIDLREEGNSMYEKESY